MTKRGSRARRRSTSRVAWGRTTLLMVLMVPYLWPFVYVFYTSFKSNTSFTTNEIALSGFRGLVSYRQAWDATDLGVELLHSALAAAVGVVISLVASVLGGYWLFSYANRHAKAAVAGVLIVAMAVPGTVYVVPLFIQLASRHMVNNLFFLGLIYGAIGTPLGCFLMRAYLMQLPESIFDAAAVDGTTTLPLLGLIVVPLAAPTIGTIATLVGILGMNDLLFASVMITGNSQTTGIVGIASLANQYNSQIPEVSAGVMIALLPVLAIFLAAQQALRRGITAGVDR